jgi:hypothetical protein
VRWIIKFYKRVHPEWVVEEPLSGFQILAPLLTGALSSGHTGAILQKIYERAGILDDAASALNVQKRLMWAGMQWSKSGMPIYRMEPELQDMLLNTELPDKLTELPHLPLPGIYLACDRFKVWNNDTGMHDSEGVYVVEDLVCRSKGAKAERGYMCISVGKSKNGQRAMNPLTGKWEQGEAVRDDALTWGAIVPDADLKGIKGATQGFEEGVRLAMNFLLLWNATGQHLEHKKVSPKLPQGKKLKRFKSQKKSSTPFFLVTLRDREEAKRIRTEVSGWTGETHRVLVSGHWRRQWLQLPDEGTQVVGEKVNEKGTKLSCVWKYIGPHPAVRRGAGVKRAKNFKVKYAKRGSQ